MKEYKVTELDLERTKNRLLKLMIENVDDITSEQVENVIEELKTEYSTGNKGVEKKEQK